MDLVVETTLVRRNRCQPQLAPMEVTIPYEAKIAVEHFGSEHSGRFDRNPQLKAALPICRRAHSQPNFLCIDRFALILAVGTQ